MTSPTERGSVLGSWRVEFHQSRGLCGLFGYLRKAVHYEHGLPMTSAGLPSHFHPTLILELYHLGVVAKALGRHRTSSVQPTVTFIHYLARRSRAVEISWEL